MGEINFVQSTSDANSVGKKSSTTTQKIGNATIDYGFFTELFNVFKFENLNLIEIEPSTYIAAGYRIQNRNQWYDPLKYER